MHVAPTLDMFAVNNKIMTTAQKIQAHRTAQQAFDEKNAAITERITKIQSKLSSFNKGFNGKNWGYVGSLDYINGLLLQIEQHLG